ncbi:WPP domain-associated protein-like [Rosa rugosa]|uniref:WPP domain-associated protein-like n=1 Tax=Rosa rugosa TaxID=74645 RepID=UPI002B4062D2|nr:WPP domain-associated protein-like [Rosa rugosa]
MQQPSSLEAVAGHDRIAESLVHLRGTTNEEFKKLKKEIDSIRGRSSMKRISSSSGLDILQDKVSDMWDVDGTLDGLKTTIETAYQQVEKMVHLSKASSVYEWQLEQEFRAKIEALVMRNCIWSVEGNMSDCFYSAKNVNWHGRKKEISGIRDELDAISKSLSVCDNGQLSSHGSLEVEEESSSGNKGAGSHLKVLNNLKSSSSLPSTITTATTSSSSASSSSSVREENGIHDESEKNMEEDLDPALLKHMKKGELISHFKNEITKLKRNHESKILVLTEQHFGYKRELPRERRFSLTLKSKEFDMLRKRISEVISKLDEILVEKEEVATLLPHTFGSNEESPSSLKDRVESLLSENHQLRDLLEDKNREIKCLSLHVSEAAECLSQHSLAEAKLLKTAGNLKAAMEDACIESSIGADLLAGIVREVVDEIKCIAEESQLENSIMNEDLNMESIITQELCGVMFKDDEEKLSELNIKYIEEYELWVLQEMDKREKEKQLEVELANKVSLQKEVHFLVEEKEQLARDAAAALEIEKERYESAAQEVENLRGETSQHQKLISESVEESNAAKRDLAEALEQNEEKEQLARNAAAALAIEKERYELAAQELENLRGEICQHQKLISESVEESNAAKLDLAEALEQNETHKADICKLEQKLEAAVKVLRQVEEDRRRLLDVNQEKQIAVTLFEAKERELREQLKSIAVYISGLLKTFTYFERRVTQDISGKCSRLKSLTSQSRSLKRKAAVLVRRGLLYKCRLEKKCSDLQRAEAEVDLLGAKVDTQLNLVEKIYIALDHYSPILQHYPGITEILELLRRELSAKFRSV